MSKLTVRFEPRNDVRSWMYIWCPVNGECRFGVRRDAAQGAEWHWDGNVERPTISPSIDCHGCGRHFNLIAGEAS